MNIVHLPAPEHKTDWQRYIDLAGKYAGLRDTTLVFALAVMKRAKEDGNDTLARGAADFIELMEKRL